jgi:hypothetical protein
MRRGRKYHSQVETRISREIKCIGGFVGIIGERFHDSPAYAAAKNIQRFQFTGSPSTKSEPFSLGIFCESIPPSSRLMAGHAALHFF